jgi:hypothetical protein
MTVCSTIASCVTNATLIIDLVQTPDFEKSGECYRVFSLIYYINKRCTGSGLTRRQRTLVIIIIILLSYIALGSLIHSFLLGLPFIDALYFTVVTIETIGRRKCGIIYTIVHQKQRVWRHPAHKHGVQSLYLFLCYHRHHQRWSGSRSDSRNRHRKSRDRLPQTSPCNA